MPKFVPRQRKHKVRARLQQQQHRQGDGPDTNASEILPESKTDKQWRKEQLKAELRAQQPAASSKKRKRLDKYIDSKLKKEENQELIKKLSQQKIDHSLLRSSKQLGKASQTKREAFSQALREQNAGINNSANNELLFRKASPSADVSSSSEPSESASEGEDDEIAPLHHHTTSHVPHAGTRPGSGFGTGLKRPLELDEAGAPIIQARKRHKPRSKRRVPLEPVEDHPQSEQSEWEGFSSSSDADECNVPDFLDAANALSRSSEHDNGGGSTPSSENEREASSSLSDNGTGTDSEQEALNERSSAFKAWATIQRNTATGYEPSRTVNVPFRDSSNVQTDQVPATSVRREQDQVLLQSNARRLFHVAVNRPQFIEDSRQELPVVAKEQEIMEAIFANDVTILSGSTGSGKTTQVPQFLFEAGYGDPNGPAPGMIGVTQPRRVAAVSMAKRVSDELGNLGEKVSHQVRFDSSVSSKTAIKFMTDGVLLREVSQDFTLSKYSVIVIDEAHERSVNTDILVGMLSRIVETRRKLSQQESASFQPLKLVIMSATLRIAEFRDNKELFRGPPPPVVDVEGKQYDVTKHFARRTKREYVEEIFEKLSRGHRKLPPGGMLVFMTGQSEISYLERRLRSTFPCTEDTASSHPKMRVSAEYETVEVDDINLDENQMTNETELNESDILGIDDSQEEDELSFPDESSTTTTKIHVLPLYSQLPSHLQARVFRDPPRNSRLIILATNVAETSLTIPNIRYVFDCGRQKCKKYDSQTGIQSFAIDWISKASAQQRAGRAGRTGPGGHCYRLYSSAVFENAFPEFSEPEITRTPVEGVVLTLKSIGIPDITKFPFPTPIGPNALQQAERLLQYLGALDLISEQLTPLGRRLNLYPISPRLARILVLAQREQSLLHHALAIVAILGATEIFVPETSLGLVQQIEPSLATEDGSHTWSQADAEATSQQEKRRKEYASFHGHMARLDKYSDGVKMLTTLIEFSANNAEKVEKFQAFTRTKVLQEALQLKRQLTTIANLHSQSVTISSEPHAPPIYPTPGEVKILRVLITAGYINNLAQRADCSPTPPASRKPKTSIQVPYIPLFPLHDLQSIPRSVLESMDEKAKERLKYVFIHSSSVLAHTNPSKLPRFLIYSHLSTSANKSVADALTREAVAAGIKPPRTRMHPLTPVSSSTLLELTKGTPLLREGKPVGKIETLDRTDDSYERRAIWSLPYLGGGEGIEWPIPPARRVVQRRIPAKGWIEE